MKVGHLMDWAEHHRSIVLLVFVIVGTLWKAYPHMSIFGLMASDEYSSWALLEHLFRYDEPVEYLIVPYLEFFLAYAVHLVTGLGSITIAKFINPVIGGLCVLAFYYLAVGFMTQREALLSSLLFTFSEPFLYRSCYFGSTEILGFLFMFIFLGLYIRKKHLWMITTMALMGYSHILPVIFSMTVVFLDTVLTKKKHKWAGIFFILVIIVIGSPISPHRKLVFNFYRVVTERGWSILTLSNLFMYNLEELILIGLLGYLGFVALFIITIPKFRQWTGFERVILGVGIAAFLGSFVLYDTAIIGPRRFIIYITIPLLLVVPRIVNRKLLLPMLIVPMIISPLIGGLDNFVFHGDSLTSEEIEAMQWLEDNGYWLTRGVEWFGDWSVSQYIESHIYVNVERTYDPKGPLNVADVLLRERTMKEYVNETGSQNTTTFQSIGSWDYAFISDRMRRRGLFIVPHFFGGRRPTIVRMPVVDIWEDSSEFKIVYDKNGVTIYERKDI